MRDRAFRRYVERLAGSARRRPLARGTVDDDQAAQLRAAIALRAARPGSGTPSEEFQTALHRRLAAEFEPPATAEAAVSRRRLVQATSVAAASVAAGVAVDRALPAGQRGPANPGQEQLSPNAGTWRTVATSEELAGGAVRGFDLGSVNGFVQREAGRLVAVSGVCTHLGCRLVLSGGGAELACPCHHTAFRPTGEVIRQQLPERLRPLPRLAVREIDNTIQVYAPD